MERIIKKLITEKVIRDQHRFFEKKKKKINRKPNWLKEVIINNKEKLTL